MEGYNAIDFDSNIDFDLKYIKINTHIKIVYDDIKKKYKNIDDYIFIPIGYNNGCFLALYFSQIYKSKCLHIILLDPCYLLEKFTDDDFYDALHYKPITNIKLKKELEFLKNSDDINNNTFSINNMCQNIRSNFIYKHLNLTLSIPTTSFVIMYKNKPIPHNGEMKNIPNFENKTKLNEIKILKKINPTNFKAILLEKKDHDIIFNKIQPAKQIIKYIYNLIKS
jgi:hypothetical protein